MDVRRAAGIRHRADRQEAVTARSVGDGLAVALEVLVARPVGAIVANVMVPAIGVALPDLDACAGYGVPSRSRTRPAIRVTTPFAGSGRPDTCTRSLSESAG